MMFVWWFWAMGVWGWDHTLKKSSPKSKCRVLTKCEYIDTIRYIASRSLVLLVVKV